MTQTADHLLSLDSLRQATEQLFLQGAHFKSKEAADTLANAVPPPTAADLFGTGSTLVQTTEIGMQEIPFTANPLFQCLVLILATIYILIIYHHSAHIRTLFSRTSFDASGGEMRSGNSYSQFLNLTGIVGLLLGGLLCVKYINLLAPTQTLPYQAAAGVSLIATTGLLLAIAIQAGILFLIGMTTRSLDFTGELTHIRRSILALTMITTTPALLFYVLAPGDTGRIWYYIFIVEVITITAFFLIKMLQFFISKKISILHWFLYLCIVEIFPISLLWLLITRQ